MPPLNKISYKGSVPTCLSGGGGKNPLSPAKRFKLPDDVPNTQLYKQAGNSVTVAMIERFAEIIHGCLSSY